MLHHLEYTRNKISSGVLLFYWLFEIIAGCIKLRTMIVSHGKTSNHPDHFAMYLIRFALSVIIFILEIVPRPQSQYIMLSDEDNDEVSLQKPGQGQLTQSKTDGLPRRKDQYLWEIDI